MMSYPAENSDTDAVKVDILSPTSVYCSLIILIRFLLLFLSFMILFFSPSSSSTSTTLSKLFHALLPRPSPSKTQILL